MYGSEKKKLLYSSPYSCNIVYSILKTMKFISVLVHIILCSVTHDIRHNRDIDIMHELTSDFTEINEVSI